MTFRGSIPAVITPFDNNLEIDYDALGNHIDFLIENKLKNEFLLWRDVDLIQQKSQ